MLFTFQCKTSATSHDGIEPVFDLIYKSAESYKLEYDQTSLALVSGCGSGVIVQLNAS